MRKLILPALLLLVVIFALFSTTSIAKDRPPIDFSDRPLKLWVPFDPKKPGDLYSINQDYVFIQADDLKEIEDAKNPTKTQVEDPPVNYQLSSATYYVTVKGEYINISGVYSINKLDDEWTLVPVISDQVGLSSATINGKPAFMTTFRTGQDLSKFKNASSVSSGNYFLAIKDKGIHTLKTNFTVKLSKDPSINTQSFSFNLPNIPIVSLHCLVDHKNLEFSVPNATSIAAKTVDKGSKLFASFPPVTNIEVKWNPKSTVKNLSDTKKDLLPPSINATSYSRIEAGKKTLNGTIRFDIDIVHAAIDHLDFYIPEGIDIDSVTASNNIELVNPDPQPVNNILSVDLTSAVEGKLTLDIKFRKMFDSSSFVATIPAITLADNMKIDRESGYVGVKEISNIESTIVEAKDITEIDSAELPGNLSGMGASIAFKYIKGKDKSKAFPYDVKIKFTRHEGIAVYEATIESTDIQSVINEDGQIFTKAIFQVTNTRKQFLEVTLPKKSYIWSVFVDGRSVKPAIKNLEKNSYSIPLAKSNSYEAGKTFPVEIVYFTNKDFPLPPSVLWPLSLKALTPELASNQVTWTIYYPKKLSFWPMSLLSNLQKDKTYGVHDKPSIMPVGLLSLSKKQSFDGAAPPPPAEYQQDRRMKDELISKEQQEMVQTSEPIPEQETDIAGLEEKSMNMPQTPMPASIVTSASVSSVSGYKQPSKVLGKGYWMQQGVFKSRKAGKLPVYVELPQVGNSYKFYQNSFEANQEPYIVTFYAHENFFEYLCLILLIIMVAVIAEPFKNKNYKSLRFILPAVLSVIILFALLGYALIFWIIILAVLVGLYKFSQWVFTLAPPLRNKVLIGTVSSLLFIVLFVVSLIIDIACFGILILLAIVVGFIALLVWFIKKRKDLWPFKRKPTENADVAQGVSEENKEGQTNE